MGGGDGGVQSHHHNLNALDAQTPPVNISMKAGGTCVGRFIGQSDVAYHLMRSAQSDWPPLAWPADLN